MELTDSSEINTRSPLGIDLNEIPSSSSPPCASLPKTESEPEQLEPDPLQLDSFDVVRSFHENQDPASGIAAGLPEEEKLPTCGACGEPEVDGRVVVCDGCERGFHLACAGMHGRQMVNLVDWICAECFSGGVKSKRWPLGVKSKLILDINASPPSDCDRDGETSEERVNLRKHSIGDNSSCRNAFGAPVSHSNHLYEGNGFGPFDFNNASGLMMKAFRVDFEDILHPAQTVNRSLEEIDLGFPVGRLRSSNITSIILPSQNPHEVLLHGLREFVSERNGILDEGWHVELKHCSSSYEVYSVYCSPDGKKFSSMSEVASYLGLPHSVITMAADANKNHESPSVQERSHSPKKRKAKRFSLASGFAANKQALADGCHKRLMPNGQTAEIGDTKFDKFTEPDAEEDDIAKSPASDDGLPVQFEDFFVISLGKIDVRQSYHDCDMIWPVGYKSCWHDKVTGSLFVCEVLDGGDNGPVFKVRRFSCSVLPIPDVSTVIYRKNSGLSAGQTMNYDDAVCSKMECENDVTVEMILADTSPPTEDDILTCLDPSSNETCGIQVSESLQDCIPSSSGNLASSDLGLADDIVEVSSEERSSSLAWRVLSQKLIEAFSEICNQTGSLKLCCKHVDNNLGLPAWDTKDERAMINFDSVAKFCSSPISVDVPLEYQGEIDRLATALSKWLDQDRFGFDTHFVQEIIEQLPGVDSCSKYERLINRSNCSISITVGNGQLIAKRKNQAELDDTCQKSKRARLGEDNCGTAKHYPPPGRLLCSKCPPVLVGDLYQVWELLCRFHELLGLKERLLLENLEDELINPWFGGANFSDNLHGKKVHESQLDLDKINRTNEPVSCSYQESSEFSHGDNANLLMHLEKETMNDSNQDRISAIYSGCAGVALTKVHNSLLSVLIGELQSKVAAIVDPNFDAGESKSRRGRRKDADSLNPLRRNKLSTLPINGLTWPELARRYILAVLSMDGNLDSAESAARESVKVFRCLRGDGGVLCGSLAGVAGMEADALFLAEAMKQIYGYLSAGKDILIFEEEVTDANGSSEKNSVNDGTIPEWVLLLEPVRRLPTNVGTRIRKCVYEALEKGPPEWAKKRLEHSISKGVYKGNASGPTKKAVLSVLADVFTEGLPHKCEKRNKRKITLPISDIVMKQCRIVLRQAAAADDAKVFCTLLGQNLVTSCDQDDEGLLGSPAMVSRPLDLRTIDLRLAVGAYGGSHASFLEDIRELWNNVQIAFRDEPDMVELAETLAHNFESLYEKEVVTLAQKLEGYAKLDHLSAETKKELDDILASINEIPKAPWDEGVCKVCGVDRDDDNVLLCDTCDAEYHTYCLNPPLARIPEGNWYCPSCVGASMVQEASSSSQVMGHPQCKKYQGEITRLYLETLMDLAVAMEEKDYWDFGIDERTFLLKFLCDELLNSALVRQHLDQCTETTAELHQKLRSLFVEWRNLKFKEEILASRAAKVDTGATEEANDGFGSLLTNQAKSIGHSPHLSDKSSQFSAGSDGAPAVGGSKKGNGTYGPDKHSSVINYTKKARCGSQAINSKDVEGKLKDLHGIRNGTNQENEKSSRSSGFSSSDELLQVSDNVDEIHGPSNMEECMERESSTFLPPPDHAGSSILLAENNHVLENVLAHAVNESQVYNSELTAIKVDILHLQSLINSIKSKLSQQSSRMEFLGSDSRGHLYWFSTTCDGHPRIIIDGSLTLQWRKISDHRDLFYHCSLLQHSSSETNTCLKLEGSRACFPFLFDPNGAVYSWISYESEAEIEQLIDWLGNNDSKERELKKSIMQLLKLRFREHQQIRDPSDKKCPQSLVMDRDEISSSDCLATKAALFLEKRYGACMEIETTCMLKRGKKPGRLTKEMYRCYCLEPIWPSRHHCHSCHRTASNDDVFEGHDDGSCNLVHLSCEKSEETNDSTRAKGRDKSQVLEKEYISELDNVPNARIGWSELGSRLIKFQNAGFECPYEFTEICSKFVTKDSNKELVEDIGLIGSNGIPSFVTSVSPYLSDSTLVLTCPKKDTTVQCGNLDDYAHQLFMQGNKNESDGGLQSLSGKFAWKTSTNEIGELLETNKPLLGLHRLGRKSSFNKCFPEMRSISYCVVPQSSLKPLPGKASLLVRRLKINLLDMEAALPEEALRLSRGCLGRRCAWRAFVKSAESIYQMIQATIVLEEMIKTEYLRNEWWYWSSLSAAAKTSTVSSLALRIYSLDACIIYEKTLSNSDPVGNLKPSSISNQQINGMDSVEKCKESRKSNKKRKEPEG